VLRRVGDTIRANEESSWRWSARIAVVLPFAALAFAVTVLAIKAWPAVRLNGGSFLTGSTWTYGSGYASVVHTDGVAHLQGETFQAWPIIAGTLLSSLFALIIAVPISIGAAFALTERLPSWIAQPLGFTIELLAGIPSVVIGLWGVLTLGPFFAQHIYPIIGNNMPDVPILSYFRSPVGYGEGLATASIVLALMIVPIITSTTRDLFTQVPPLPKEGASALGMTDFEVAQKVTVPWVRSGIIGAVVLGLGRAMGETVAVALIGGAALHVPHTVFSNFTTIAATILQQLDGAQTDGTGFAVATLAELALVLAVIVVVVNLLARVVINRSSRLGAPTGRA
jgi:phosphate transport system permease protein